MSDMKKQAAARAKVPTNYPTEEEVRNGITEREVYDRALDARVAGEIDGLARYTPTDETEHDVTVRRLMLRGQRADIQERLITIVGGSPENASSITRRRKGRARRALRRIDVLIS